MSNIFSGKSMFHWNAPAVFGGDPERIAEWMGSHNFRTLMIKVADGAYVFRPSWTGFPNWLTSALKLGKPNVSREFVNTLHAKQKNVVGWAFLYGRDPEGEGRVAAEQYIALGLRGLILDVEGQFEKMKTPDVAVRDAGKFIGAFRRVFAEYKKIHGAENTPDPQLALCCWAEFWSPSGTQWHNAKMARFFMSLPEVVAFIPMYYADYYDARGKPIPIPADKLEREFLRLLAQWGKITDKDIVPAGGAYIGDGVVPTGETVGKFGRLARLLCAGVTWWVLDSAIKIPEVDTALGLAPGWDLPAPDPIEPPVITPPRFTGKVKADTQPWLNVRVSPSANAAKLKEHLLPGTPFIGDAQSDDGRWLHITEPIAGYIAAWLTDYQEHDG